MQLTAPLRLLTLTSVSTCQVFPWTGTQNSRKNACFFFFFGFFWWLQYSKHRSLYTLDTLKCNPTTFPFLVHTPHSESDWFDLFNTDLTRLCVWAHLQICWLHTFLESIQVYSCLWRRRCWSEVSMCWSTLNMAYFHHWVIVFISLFHHFLSKLQTHFQEQCLRYKSKKLKCQYSRGCKAKRTKIQPYYWFNLFYWLRFIKIVTLSPKQLRFALCGGCSPAVLWHNI